MIHVALPPGLYWITAPNKKGWVIPKSSDAPLRLEGLSNKKEWKFTGDGRFICPKGAYYAYCTAPKADDNVCGAADKCTTWTVNVIDQGDGSFKGTIMASNEEIVYWAIDGNAVVLKEDAWDFIFTPVV